MIAPASFNGVKKKKKKGSYRRNSYMEKCLSEYLQVMLEDTLAGPALTKDRAFTRSICTMCVCVSRQKYAARPSQSLMNKIRGNCKLLTSHAIRVPRRGMWQHPFNIFPVFTFGRRKLCGAAMQLKLLHSSAC